MRMNESKPTRDRRIPTAAGTRTRAQRAAREQPAARPGDEQIRLRAYEIYLRRDGRPGDPADDWFCAEREVIEGAPAPALPAPGRPRAVIRSGSWRTPADGRQRAGKQTCQGGE